MKNEVKIKGLKKAVGKFQRANEDGPWSSHYGYLMYDSSDGQLWTDEFESIGHNSWNEYHSSTIVNLGGLMAQHGMTVSMKNVREFIEKGLYKIDFSRDW